MEDKTGHHDEKGNRVDETPQAKLRNQLGPFWTLVSILDGERLSKLLSTPEGETMIQTCVEQCKISQKEILDIIKQTEKK